MLAGTVAGEEEVGVRIDQTRREQVALRVDHLVRLGRVRARADEGDALSLAGHRSVLDEPERRIAGRRLRPGHGGDTRVADQEHAPTLSVRGR